MVPVTDEKTTKVVSPCGLGSFSFGAKARTDGPRRDQIDDYRGQAYPHERLAQLVKALPTG